MAQIRREFSENRLFFGVIGGRSPISEVIQHEKIGGGKNPEFSGPRAPALMWDPALVSRNSHFSERLRAKSPPGRGPGKSRFFAKFPENRIFRRRFHF